METGYVIAMYDYKYVIEESWMHESNHTGMHYVQSGQMDIPVLAGISIVECHPGVIPDLAGCW